MDQSSPPSIAQSFARAVDRRGDEKALGFIRGGELTWLTWQQVSDFATALAAELRSAGIEPGDRVAHVSENRHEWIITDLALHLAGAVHVPIHTTLSGEQIAQQIADSGAKLVFVSNRDVLRKFAACVDSRVLIWLHDEHTCKAASRSNSQSLAPGSQSPNPDDLATILYTSGTTGRPRGVMLSHRNLASNVAAVCEAHGVDSNVLLLCILPLSHIYARTCDLYTWLCSGSQLVLADSRETLLRDSKLVQPTAINAVPFVYQRIMEAIRKSEMADEAAALRNEFGGRVQKLFCGGAPIAPDVEAWYEARGLPLLAGYGMTEASPVVAVSTPEARRAGSVGRRLPGVEVRIASDGEILIRGPNIMLGYWQDEAATAEVIRDGWYHTGDLGELDHDGYLFIRGRKKELIVLSTGKKVPPTRVESLLTASPLIQQAAVFGDGQCGLVALIVPADFQSATQELYAKEIDRCLQDAAHEEQVHRFALLDRPFSIDRGELTAKMSLCRAVIAHNFAAELQTIQPQRSQSSRREEVQTGSKSQVAEFARIRKSS